MEKAKFEEARKQNEIIECCDEIIKTYEKVKSFYMDDVESLIKLNDETKESFINWVANEKEIAKKKFNEI